MVITPIMIGLLLVIIGVLAAVAGYLKIANLEINFKTKKGFFVFIFSLLHVLGGLILIAAYKVN